MADLPHRNSTPLITIHFGGAVSPVITRHWHHVPRVGDHVGLTAEALTLDGDPSIVVGTVVKVTWLDGGDVNIELGPEWLPDREGT